ncbi:GNAT family N-acetyltransferase [Nocardioides sp.]|uniref:GNAT family N-acetyltransferase n=1 Tax=Nocardioides sp. TaxID=35761 RepID=UPI002EDB8933
MGDLGSVPWPCPPIRTERLVLRQSEARDRAAVIELYASAEVHAYLGGPHARDELERAVPEVPGRRPGYFVVELDGAAIGTVTLGRRDAERPGSPPSAAGPVELSYLFLPAAWGHGYATEACSAALAWLADVLPGERVVVCTQVANGPSMRLAAKLGFSEVERFVEFGAEQWFGVRDPAPVPGSARVG